MATITTSEKEIFIKQIAKYVNKYKDTYNVKVASPIIAQACLESAFGTSELAKNAQNYFGLKYNAQVSTQYYIKNAIEQKSDGTYYNVNDTKWCKFNNIEECVKGYFVFLFGRKGVTRYENLKNVSDAKTYLQNIKNDGYATSNNYVDNVYKVITTYNLTKYDTTQKSSTNTTKNSTKTYNTYVVVKGDTLYKIAKNKLGNGMRYKEIKTLNNLKSNIIKVGQVLKLPTK